MFPTPSDAVVSSSPQAARPRRGSWNAAFTYVNVAFLFVMTQSPQAPVAASDPSLLNFPTV